MRKTTWVLPLLAIACATPDSTPLPGGPPHHTATGFRNIDIPIKDTDFFDFMKMRYFGDDEWADYAGRAHLVPQRAADHDVIDTPGPAPQITWLGHSTVLVQYRGVNLLTDPIFSERASPFSFAGPKRVTRPGMALDRLPPIDFVVISHNHYDHLDQETVRVIGDRARWLTPLGYTEWFSEQGVSNVTELDWWQSLKLPLIEFTATPVQHWTGRWLDDRYRMLWSGWSVRIDDFNFYFAGDTGYNQTHFVETGERLGPFDLALIPIGGYLPSWFMGDMHVNPEQAVQIHKDVKSRYSLGVHWGTFPLTAEPIDEPLRRLTAAAAGLRDSRFVTQAIGETVRMR